MSTSISGRHVAATRAVALAAATLALLLAASAAAAQVDPSAVRDGWSVSAASPEPMPGGQVRDGWSAYAARAAGEAPAGSYRDGWSAYAGTGAAGTPAVSSRGPVPAHAAAAAGQERFVPFVTDFGKEPRVPGRTVVIGPLRPVAAPAPVAEPVSGRSWADVALGATMGAGLATLLALGLVGGRRLRGRAEAALADAPAGAAR
jgi:hypothetical protein